MKTIGLIGGMSFESTAVYYDRLNRMAQAEFGGFTSAKVLLHSVNFAEVVALQKSGNWDEAGRMLGAIGRNLQNAGADCVLICTNTMHKVADAVALAIDIPLVNIINETATSLNAAGCKRPLLLATRYTMEDGFYSRQMAASGIELMVPEKAGRDLVHDIIFSELCQGKVLDTSRTIMLDIIDEMKTAGADSVILGCTEICMLLDPDRLALPGFDSTQIHCLAAAQLAFGTSDTLDTKRKYA